MRMSKRTQDALLQSVIKWAGVARGTTINKGIKNCPLCKLFYERPKKARCEGCPVQKHHGRMDCHDTPYWTFMALATEKQGAEFTAETPKQRAAAIAEMRFLASLLPKA